MDNADTAFESFALSPETRSSLAAMGYRYPTASQQEALPRAQSGRDLVVQSRTGTGKTAAFGIPIVERVDVERAVVQALVLAPTRELALQVSAEIASIGRGRCVKVETVYGGDPIERQLASLDSGVHVVAGTPGRVLDHLRRGSLDLTALRVLVLDEADRMLDMGFAVEMGQIMEYVPDERQTLLFSATVPLGIRGLIYHYMAEPEWLLLSEDQVYVKEVAHCYCLTPKVQKEEVLYRLIEHESVVASMVFCNTREETRRVYAFLQGRGLPAAMLSSDLAQRRRERVMDSFKARRVRHLVTTDVASRGIDIEDLSHVFVYSTPESPEQYIHRAGRTGRIGKGGRVISLVSAHDLMSFNRLVRRYQIDVTEIAVPSEEEVRQSQAERIVGDLRERQASLAVEEALTLLPIAKGVLAHAQAERLVAVLLKGFLSPVASLEDEEDESAPAPAPQPSQAPRPRRRGRRGKRRG